MMKAKKLRGWAVGVVALFLVAGCAGAMMEGGKGYSWQGQPVLGKVFYADTWTWPFQTDLLKHMKRGKFYVPVQDEAKIAVIDPDLPDYGLKFVKTDFVQPHHPWTAPGMRYVYINFQSERKGDHDAFAILDTRTDKIIKYIRTGINDPFHGAFSPTENLYVTGDLDLKAGHVHLIDTEKHELVASIKTSGTRTRDITISHDGRYAFIGHQGYNPKKGNMGSVDVLDIRQRKIIKSLGAGRCRSGKMSNSGRIVLYSCDRVDQLLAIDVPNLKVLKKIQLPKKSQPFNITFRPDDKYAYVGFLKSGKLGIIDVEKLELAKALPSGKRTNSTYIHPYAPLAVSTNDGTEAHISIVDIERNEIIDKIETAGKGTHNAQWSPDGRWCLISNRLGDSATLLTYDGKTKKIVKVDDVAIGFGANGVHWVPYFTGVESLTQDNVKGVKQQAALR